MRDLVHKIGAGVFVPAFDNASPIGPEARRVKRIARLVGPDAHLPVFVGKERDKDVGEIVIAGRKHRGQRQLLMMNVVHDVPIAKNLADLRAHRVPYCRSAKTGQIASEDGIDAQRQTDKASAGTDGVLVGRAVFFGAKPDFLGDHAHRLFPHRLVDVGGGERLVGGRIAALV